MDETERKSSFPQNPEEFDSDPRVSFSKLDSKFILETDDGQEYEYDDGLKRWVPVLDDDLIEQQRKAYAVQGVDESEPALQPKKRKKEHINGEEEEGGRVVTKKSKPTPEPRERKNTAVYVQNLPLDVDVEEINRVFSRCGVIAEEIDEGKPRIKLYLDDQGNPKGDALIMYFRPESVALAVQMLDDSDLRLGEEAPGGKMKVAAADFSYKAQRDAPPKGSAKTKKKIIKKTQKMNNKLADWDDDDPSTMHDTSSRWDKVEDPAAMLDIKEDIREECEKLGPVTNVVLYDKEPDGVASVRYQEPEAARACVEVMNGRFFSGTQVIAHIATGSEKFQKSNPKKSNIEEDEVEGADKEAEDKKRLDKFGTWLEEEEKEAEVDAEDGS
ncbi:hypothetical protein MMC25_007977 [Agyrium rufum]|nr:hypothetical protein [Agyrium rufum]